ncbi:hypothetical protein QYE76_036716 [Lolium multiflorum]|uniref:FBD domain-containing protein n=1 Tax=Lolium multiflorum TaxID=4521 RepID=A0AAD8R1I4_LOLMU|nr:hypothetical protein QYE76_036716 [Lolium multiflorum]
MELSSGFPRRSSQQLGPASGGEDRISALDDDMLLLVLARLGCFRAAARTGGLSRRWRGLCASLRHIVFCDVPFPSLEAALGRVTRPPPGLSLLEIRVTDMQPSRDAAGVTSLLCAAALLEPKELVLALPSGYMGNLSPLFFLQLPDHVRFHQLETLSLLGCHLRFDSLLPCCPRLRVLRLKFNDRWGHYSIRTFMSLHSTSLQELSVDVENVSIDTVDLVAPDLKKLTVSLKAFREVNISILAPMLEKLSWKCSYSFINFGPWRIAKLWLQKAERQGELPSLLIHARISSSIVHGEAENSTQEIEKHMLAKFSVLELHLRPKGHAFGAFMFHLLGMNRFFRATQRLKVVLQRSSLKQECPLDCACDHPDWRSRTSSLTALEEVEISGFQGHDHEIDFLKLIFKCAPMLKRMIVRFPHEVLYRDHHGCTQIRNILREYSSVECYLYLSSASAAGLEHGSDGFPST